MIWLLKLEVLDTIVLMSSLTSSYGGETMISSIKKVHMPMARTQIEVTLFLKAHHVDQITLLSD